MRLFRRLPRLLDGQSWRQIVSDLVFYGLKFCTIADCGLLLRCKGMCSKHYQAARRKQVKANKPARIPRVKQCIKCDGKSVARRMCVMHYQQWRREHGKGLRIKVEPCDDGRKIHEYSEKSGKCLHCGYIKTQEWT